VSVPTEVVLQGLIDERFVESTYRMTGPVFVQAVLSADADLVDAAPNGVFDVAWYRDTNKISNHTSALVHYLTKGWTNGLAPSAFFDPGIYRSSGPALEETEEPLGHFLRHGQHEGRLPLEPLHEPLQQVMTDPALAPIANAFRRAIKNHQLFDLEWYAFANGFDDEVEAELDYWTRGFNEHAAPNAFLDPEEYLTHNPDVAASGWSPVLHYMIEGWNQGRDPSRRLSLHWFWQNNERVEPIARIQTGEAHPAAIAADYGVHPPNQISDLKLQTYFEPRSLEGRFEAFNPESMAIDWIVPDFGLGSGGHTNIFRFARMLTERGHRNRIWVSWPTIHNRTDDLAANLRSFYGVDNVPIDFLPADPQLAELTGDAIVATAWQTVFPALSLSQYRRRFYLVQDYEPLFSPAGSHQLAAASTYAADFDAFCASPWLQRKMAEHGRWSELFWLAPNWDVYFPPKNRKPNAMVQVVAYARDHTSRRCVELLEAALRVLGQRGTAVQVVGFGLSPEATARWRGLGIEVDCRGYIAPDQVAELYRTSDIGVSLSGTNYSAVPPDMMACELPVIELATEATRETILPEAVLLAEPSGVAIADAIEALATDPDRRKQLAAAGYSWVSTFSWANGADTIEAGISQRITSAGAGISRSSEVQMPETVGRSASKPVASVIIPTLNAGTEFAPVLEAVFDQQADFPFEVLVVDSSSEDNTVEMADAMGARTIVVDRSTFQHGRTRNLAVHESQGFFAALITQDARPFDDQWLNELVKPMLENPDVGGVFGRHVAHEWASPFAHDELERHFAGFDAHPAVMNRFSDEGRYHSGDPGWRQLLYFYSDNNSCLRKATWRTIPYPSIPFGEDQAWAQMIIDAGWSKAYAKDAVVAHSHDYEPDEARYRASEEALFFRDWFGLMSIPTKRQLNDALRDAERANAEAAERLGVDESGLAHQNAVTAAKLEGLYRGSHGLLAKRS